MHTYNNPQQTPEQSALVLRPSEPLVVEVVDGVFTPADEMYLLEIFTECRKKLESALSTAQGYSRLPDLEKGIADAITGIHEAAAVVLEPQTYME